MESLTDKVMLMALLVATMASEDPSQLDEFEIISDHDDTEMTLAEEECESSPMKVDDRTIYSNNVQKVTRVTKSGTDPIYPKDTTFKHQPHYIVEWNVKKDIANTDVTLPSTKHKFVPVKHDAIVVRITTYDEKPARDCTRIFDCEKKHSESFVLLSYTRAGGSGRKSRTLTLESTDHSVYNVHHGHSSDCDKVEAFLKEYQQHSLPSLLQDHLIEKTVECRSLQSQLAEKTRKCKQLQAELKVAQTTCTDLRAKNTSFEMWHNSLSSSLDQIRAQVNQKFLNYNRGKVHRIPILHDMMQRAARQICAFIDSTKNVLTAM